MPERDFLPCPGCHTPLPPEATGCQICMRSRTKQEIVRGYAKLREERARERRRPFQILAAVIVLGVGGALIATYRDTIMAAVRESRGAVVRWIDAMRDPKYYFPFPSPAPPSEKPPAAARQDSAPVLVPPAKLSASDAPPASPAPTPGPAPVLAAAPPARPKSVAKNAWRVAGTVYDLATLATVPGTVITFLKDEKEPARATTDAKGAYKIDLAKGDGWTVSMKAPNRRRGQVLDIDPPYRVRDADERRATLEALTDEDLMSAPVGWNRARSTVRLDLIAVPQRWTAVPRRSTRP